MVNLRLKVTHIIHAKARYAAELTGSPISKVYEAVLFYAMYNASPDEIAAKVEDYQGVIPPAGQTPDTDELPF